MDEGEQFVRELLEEAPQGVVVMDRGLDAEGNRRIDWWACSRYGIAMRIEPGCLWADAVEIHRCKPHAQYGEWYDGKYLTGRSEVVDYLRSIIAEYQPAAKI